MYFLQGHDEEAVRARRRRRFTARHIADAFLIGVVVGFALTAGVGVLATWVQ